MLIATTLPPDVIAPFLFEYPNRSPKVFDIEQQAFRAIAWPPQVVGRAFGFDIGSHGAQLWPPGWPLFAAYSIKLFLIGVPFWFLTGIVAFELFRRIGGLVLRKFLGETSPPRL